MLNCSCEKLGSSKGYLKIGAAKIYNRFTRQCSIRDNHAVTM